MLFQPLAKLSQLSNDDIRQRVELVHLDDQAIDEVLLDDDPQVIGQLTEFGPGLTGAEFHE
ncbi:MAG: hypothetical protein ACR2NU_16110 [Aeoliella sp.]